jgi:hypothetical protein
MLLCALLLSTQDPVPRPDADPEGTVVDERGAAIAGATVEILGEFPADSLFARATAQILTRTPLPATRSDKDGHFVLPLSAEQRLLGAWLGSGDEELWLVVRKDGHLTWREPLSTGLRGYLGSRVVLPALPAAGRFAALPWPPVQTFSAKSHTTGFCAIPAAAPALTRRPPPAGTAGSRGGSRLVVRVRDDEGHAVAHAHLKLANPFFEAASVAARPAVTDAAGVYMVDEVPEAALASQELLVSAPGYPFGQPLERACKREGVAVTLDVTIESKETQRYLTVDAQGAPVPFTPVLAEYGGRNALRTVLSDSCGRLLLPVRPDSENFCGWRHHGDPRHQLVDGLWHLLVAPQVGVLVRMDPWSRLQCSWRSKGTSGSLGVVEGESPRDVCFLWCLARDGDVVTLTPTPGSPRNVAFAGLEVQMLGCFPCALVDLRASR